MPTMSAGVEPEAADSSKAVDSMRGKMAKVKLDPPLEMDFNGNPGLRKFTTLEAVEEFVGSDQKAWGPFLQKVNSLAQQGFPGVMRFIQNHSQGINEIVREVNQQRQAVNSGSVSSAPLQNTLSRYRNRSCLHAESALGRRALDLLERNMAEAAMIVASATAGANSILLQTQQQGSIPAFSLIKGTAVTALSDQKLLPATQLDAERLDDVIAAGDRAAIATTDALTKFVSDSNNELSTFIEKRDQALSALESNLADLAVKSTEQLNNAKDALEQQRSSHEQSMAGIQAVFREGMKLRAPRTYWEEKEREHKTQASFWLLRFWIGCALVACGSVAYVLVGVRFEPNWLSKAKDFPISWLIIGIPALISLWVLRLLNKQATVHLSLNQDARERVAMIDTYVALFDDQKIQVSERTLVLQPLFRPSLVTGDDGVQTIADRLLDLLSKK